MSSGTPYAPTFGRRMQELLSAEFMARNARLGMTPRQQRLNDLYSRYTCSQYDARKVGWDGREHVGGIEAEAIATQGYIPPGFYDAGASFPLKFRRPSAPYHLVRLVVSKFTGLLFAEDTHPTISVAGDPDSTDYVEGMVEQARLWQTMLLARDLGGAMGTVPVTFQFVDGRALVETHDARWCTPVFADRAQLRLRSLEIRYIYPEDVRDPVSGEVTEVAMWYRRMIDEHSDVLYAPVAVGDGEEPQWDQVPVTRVDHGQGEFPGVWLQNLPVIDDFDGEPDCHGVFELAEEIDRLISQANKGILANCDPTIHIATDSQLSEVRVGSDNAIKTEKGGSAQFLELQASGPKAATEQAEKLKGWACEVAEVVLEHPDNATNTKTATEIERLYSSMHRKASKMREQYGTRGVLQLVEVMLRTARKLGEPQPSADPERPGMVRRGLMLPPKITTDEHGNVLERKDRRLGPGGQLTLTWPPFVQPTVTDAQAAGTAAVAAKAGGVIDEEAAQHFAAPYFRVPDVAAMRRRLQVQKRAEQEGDDGDMMDRQAQLRGGAAGGAAGKLPAEMLAAVVYVHEVRASIGQPPLQLPDGSRDPDNDLKLAEYLAKHKVTIAAAVSATEGTGGGGQPPAIAPPGAPQPPNA